MAGDEFLLVLVDPIHFRVIDTFLLGNLRYNNGYTLDNFIYDGDSTPFERKKRLSDGRWHGEIWDDALIEEIQSKIHDLGEPVTSSEREAHEQTMYAFEWISNSLNKHPEAKICFEVSHDF